MQNAPIIPARVKIEEVTPARKHLVMGKTFGVVSAICGAIFLVALATDAMSLGMIPDYLKWGMLAASIVSLLTKAGLTQRYKVTSGEDGEPPIIH